MEKCSSLKKVSLCSVKDWIKWQRQQKWCDVWGSGGPVWPICSCYVRLSHFLTLRVVIITQLREKQGLKNLLRTLTRTTRKVFYQYSWWFYMLKLISYSVKYAVFQHFPWVLFSLLLFTKPSIRANHFIFFICTNKVIQRVKQWKTSKIQPQPSIWYAGWNRENTGRKHWIAVLNKIKVFKEQGFSHAKWSFSLFIPGMHPSHCVCSIYCWEKGSDIWQEGGRQCSTEAAIVLQRLERTVSTVTQVSARSPCCRDEA